MPLFSGTMYACRSFIKAHFVRDPYHFDKRCTPQAIQRDWFAVTRDTEGLLWIEPAERKEGER